MTDYKEVADAIMGQIGRTNVEAIFGETRQFGDKAIIPVGKISYGWGGGGGKGEMKGKEQPEPGGKQEGEGSGVGMGVKIKPMGFITVTADRVTYEPILDFGPVILIAGSIFGLALLKVFKGMSMMMAAKGCPIKGGFMHHGKHHLMHHRGPHMGMDKDK